jgi:hypothetical protein
MKKIFSIFFFSLLIFVLFRSNVYAQECFGDSSGQSGSCVYFSWDCEPPDFIDGKGGCSLLQGCCVEVSTGGSCILTILQPVVVGQEAPAGITQGDPNTTYGIAIVPFGDTGSCSNPGTFTTNASGDYAFITTCTEPGSYAATAISAADPPKNCSALFNVLSAPPIEGFQCSNVAACQGTESDCTIVYDWQIGANCYTTCPTRPVKCVNAVRASDSSYLFDCCASATGGGGPVGTNPLGQGGCGSEELYTAIGCIPVQDTGLFIAWLLRWTTGFAGGIAFILTIYAGFMIITSAGSPQRVQAGKELLTAAVTGLMVLIFGAFILEFIGFTILNIPGFGG